MKIAIQKRCHTCVSAPVLTCSVTSFTVFTDHGGRGQRGAAIRAATRWQRAIEVTQFNMMYIYEWCWVEVF